jgi:hypothetical protein
MCHNQGSRLEILFDSPIWNYTEQELNHSVHGKVISSKIDLLNMPLTKIWAKFLTDEERTSQGFIGYCWENNLEWANKHYKGHPPSSSHWQFYNDVIKTKLEHYITLAPLPELTDKIFNMDKLWKK